MVGMILNLSIALLIGVEEFLGVKWREQISVSMLHKLNEIKLCPTSI